MVVLETSKKDTSAREVNVDVAEGRRVLGLVGPPHFATYVPAVTPAPYYEALMHRPWLSNAYGPPILRSHVSTAHYKVIPHNDHPVDLDGYLWKEPYDWGMDDVIAWMIAVARKHRIPIEDINMHRFASCSGTLLMLMSEQNFADNDNLYGPLLYREFRNLVREETNFVDAWMSRLYARPLKDRPASTLAANPEMVPSYEEPTPQQATLTSPNDSHTSFMTPSPSTAAADEKEQGETSENKLPQSSDYQLESLETTPGVISEDLTDRTKRTDPENTRKSESPAKRQKLLKRPRKLNGRPKRRSQHNKGNKLWEFIRDALSHAETSPSVVRWENENQGVFRIIDSEKLAKLWGIRKNNQRMTYEKLSRAMRTYYEKEILVPVPKTGVYPKKLVYKFGPAGVRTKASTDIKLEMDSETDTGVDFASAGYLNQPGNSDKPGFKPNLVMDIDGPKYDSATEKEVSLILTNDLPRSVIKA